MGLYAVAVLLVLALVALSIPAFAKTHHWMAAIYLALAFHTLVLRSNDLLGQPVGWALAMLLASGTVSAVGAAGPGRCAAHRARCIESLQTYPALNVLETTLRMDPAWPGHRPGQFAFAMSNPKEGPHPTRWPQPGCRKTGASPSSQGLGDHTRRLPERLRLATG